MAATAMEVTLKLMIVMVMVVIAAGPPASLGWLAGTHTMMVPLLLPAPLAVWPLLLLLLLLLL